jgi:predicted N-acyltransferase
MDREAEDESGPEATLSVVSSLASVAREEWDAVANPGWQVGRHGALEPAGAPSAPYNPFLSHDFRSLLEDSGCVSRRTGWLPQHLLLHDEAGVLLGAVPAYLKNHSMGEYVFDHGWADAFERAGGAYYPKLQVSVPFTPATGPRLLARTGTEAVRPVLAAGLVALARQREASSVHVTFATEAEWQALAREGWLPRTDRQFHWFNEGYATFEDFLAGFASRKRKQVKRERREAVVAGIEIERLTGAAITEAHWDAFFGFYMDTADRKWGQPYLNRRFFSLLGERMRDRVLLVLARREGAYIAGAFNLIGSDALYGRNWGAIEHHPFLHFEVCYHQAIEFAIERGLDRVEAGAQGEHKLARGYRPVPTYSAHWIAHRGLRDAVARHLDRERVSIAAEIEFLDEHTPFRHGGEG